MQTLKYGVRIEPCRACSVIGRDRFQARAHVGDLSPYVAFPEASLRSRTVGFPESGSDLGFSIPPPSHHQVGLNAGSYTPLLAMVCIAKLRPFFNGTPLPGSVSGDAQEPPSAQGLFARSGCYPSRRDVLRHVGERYHAF